LIKIGIDALYEDVRTGSGGLTYLQKMTEYLGQLVLEDQRAELYAFVRPSGASTFIYPGIHIVQCGSISECTAGRILTQQYVIPNKAARLNLSCLFCSGNVVPILSPVPSVMVIQSPFLFSTPKTQGLLRRLYRPLLGRLSIKHATQIVAISKYQAKELIESASIPPERISVVYLASDWTPIEHETRSPAPLDKPYVLYVSTLFEHKNHEALVRAFSIIHKIPKYSEHLLVLIGADHTGRKFELQRMSEEMGIGNSVLFLGHIEREKTKAYYQNASVSVYLSLIETFGLPILEAMSQGTPLVVSNRTAVPEVAGDAALVVDPTNPEAIAAAIIRFLSNDDLRKEYIAKGYRRITCFDWKQSARQIYQILMDVSQID
jgi:glycosyltransferase involved in cell wall biosynthesis